MALGVDRPEPIAKYREKRGISRIVTYSLYPGKLLVRVEGIVGIFEFYADVTEIAEGHIDKPSGLGFYGVAIAGFSLLAILISASVWREREHVAGAALAAVGVAGLVAVWLRARRSCPTRILSLPARGMGLPFGLRPERVGEVEAFIRAVMKERERVLREGPAVPLGPKERLNAAQRLLRLKEMLDGGYITPEQFERFKEMALKAP